MFSFSPRWAGRILRLLLALSPLLLLTSPAPIAAQSLISGDIAGTVTDPTGAAIPNATITIKNNGTGLTKSVQSGGSGEFHVGLLPPGQYTVSVTAPNFQTAQISATVAVGQTATANAALQVAQGATTVQVQGASVPLLQPENSDMSTTISQQQVQNLPNPGGDVTYYMNLTQGAVMNTQGGYGNTSAFGLPATSNNFTVNGAEENDPFLNLNNSGPSNLLLGQNDIGEVNVTANAYSAQYGSLGGVQENITTRSGSNAFHGNLTYWWTNNDLNANTWFNDSTTPITPEPYGNANQWGASIGGPIKHDKAFFFVNYEGLRFVTSPTDVVFVPSLSYESSVIGSLTAAGNAAEIPFYNHMFSLYNAAPGRSRATSYAPGIDSYVENPKNHLAEVLVTARADFKLSNNDNAFIHFRRDHGVQPTYEDPISSVFNAQSDQPEYDGQLEETHSFSPNVVNQFILSGSWYSAYFLNVNQAAADATFPMGMIFYDGSFSNMGGADYAWPQGRNVTQYQVNDDVSWTHGNHTISFGALFKRDDTTDADLGSNATALGYELGPASGPLSASDMFAAGTLYYAQQSFPQRLTEPIATSNLGAYIQDIWKVRPNFQITYGVRVEHNGNPVCGTNCFGRFGDSYNTVTAGLSTPYSQAIVSGLHSAFNQFQTVSVDPRVGFTFSPPGHDHTVLRGGFGMFNDIFPAVIADDLLTNAPLNPQFNTLGALIDPSQPGSYEDVLTSTDAGFRAGFAGGGSYKTISATNPSFTVPNMYNVDRNLKYPAYEEYSLQWQQQIGNHDSFQIGYVGNHGYHEPVENNGVNAARTSPLYPGTTVNFGGLPASQALPAFGQITEIESEASSNYNGLLVGFKHQSKIATAQVNYTWSHALDEISNGGILGFGGNAYYPIDPFNLSLNYGNADYDLRHNLNGSYLIMIPKFKGPRLLTDRWQVGGTVFWHTGFPFSVTSSGAAGALNSFGTYGPANGSGGTLLADIVNPNVSRHCGKAAATAATPCLNAADFAHPTSFFEAGTQRRNQFFGPRYFDTDFNLLKGFKLPGADTNMLQVGVQAFNILNHPNFGNPTFDMDSSTFGTILKTVSPPTSVYGSFLGADASPRILQLKANVQF